MTRKVRLSTMAPFFGGIVTAATLIVAFLLARDSQLDRTAEPARDVVLEFIEDYLAAAQRLGATIPE